jgi:hypothetical protein
MAEKENRDAVLELYFPMGISEAVAYSHQPALTTPIILNSRIRDVSENRARGGQREGLKKVFDEQVGTDRPVLRIVTIVNTFIPASE